MPGSIVGYVVSLQLCRVNFTGMLIPTNKPKTEAFRASEGLNASRIQVSFNDELLFLTVPAVSAGVPDGFDGLPFKPEVLHLLGEIIGRHDLVIVDPAVAVCIGPMNARDPDKGVSAY